MIRNQLIRKVLAFIGLALIMGLSQPVLAQGKDNPLTTKSKKAKKTFEDAVTLYTGGNFARAGLELMKAIDYDKEFIEAYLLLGDVCTETKQTGEAINAYTNAIKIDSAFFPNAFFLLAGLELSVGKYQQARQHYSSFLAFKGIPQEKRALCDTKIKNCDFSLWAIAHPVPFNPVNLGDSINSADDEYINAITADDLELFFTRKLLKSDAVTGKQRMEEDFYRSVNRDGRWSLAKPLGAPVNTGGDEGALCISPDGMDLYFAAGYRPDGFGRFDIYHARREGGGWTVPVNIGEPVNTPSWESQPSVSSDGKTLYFASLRKGGLGSSDIWKSSLQADGSWSEPENLGDKINTLQSEMNPFIHPDGQTLYFSSSGHTGLGGYDLFYSRLDSTGNWGTPVNLGYPINSWADEINLIVNARGDLAYFSSDKLGGYGKEDIYAFELYPEARPVLVNYMKGKVFDRDTRRPLEARFELIDLQNGKTMVTSQSEPAKGEFLVALPSGKDYALHVSKEGYLFYSENISLAGIHSSDTPFLKDVPLQPFKTGEIVVMNNIFYETDKAELKPSSRIELDRLVNLLVKNPALHIEIRGHTDNVGTEDHNQKLSENRAKGVYIYLVDKGIAAGRLTYKGYGYSVPVAGNNTEEGRQLNRRTEFKVIEK